MVRIAKGKVEMDGDPLKRLLVEIEKAIRNN